MQSESSGVKLTRFEIEGGLELIKTPSVNILHQSDCAWPCCLPSQCGFSSNFTYYKSGSIQIFDKKFCPMKLDKARAEFCLIFLFVFWAMEFQEEMLLRFTDL